MLAWCSNHRPHSRQVTGARCTEVAARQSWAEYSSRPTMDSRLQGWAITDFSVLSEMRSICEQPVYGIILMTLHINKSCVFISNQNLQIFLESNASGHSHVLFTSCHWARTCLMIMGQWLQPQRIPYMVCLIQHLLTCGEQVTKIWSTNLHCADA